MTRQVGNTLVIEAEPPAKCELCDKVAELRPYGPKGENICFACGKKDLQAAAKAFAKRLGIQ